MKKINVREKETINKDSFEFKINFKGVESTTSYAVNKDYKTKEGGYTIVKMENPSTVNGDITINLIFKSYKCVMSNVSIEQNRQTAIKNLQKVNE